MSTAVDTTTTTPAPASADQLAATNATLAELAKTLKEGLAVQRATPAPVTAPAPTPAAAPTRVTHAQLMEAVDAGKMSMAHALALQEAQLRQDIGAEITRATQAAAAESATVSRTQAAIDKLIAEFPDFTTLGTEVCNDFNREYAELQTHGALPNLATQLAAARVVAQRHRKPAPEPEETTAASARTQEVLTASTGTKVTGASRTRSVWHGIPDDVREQYTKLMKRGVWKGEDDPKFKTVLDGVRARLSNRRVVTVSG